MNTNKHSILKTPKILFVMLALAIFVTPILADPLPGRDVLKFSQRPMDQVVMPDGQVYWGHDELSTIYGSHVDNKYGTASSASGSSPGAFMADDFADNYDSDVVHVKWWGSYLTNVGAGNVSRFLISFESDIPVGAAGGFSTPGQPLLSQVVDRGTLSVQSGTFTETLVNPGGPPLGEHLYEYNAELKIPFAQQADTVYWLKIVALVDVDADGVIRWGWHNRDYTVPNPLASPNVFPGEVNQGPGPFSDPAAPIWHFQDDAVTGIIDYVDLYPTPAVYSGADIYQPEWSFMPTDYVDIWDGPDGISNFSKDLAFELYTVPEPATMSLLAVGGLAALKRRRRK